MRRKALPEGELRHACQLGARALTRHVNRPLVLSDSKRLTRGAGRDVLPEVVLRPFALDDERLHGQNFFGAAERRRGVVDELLLRRRFRASRENPHRQQRERYLTFHVRSPGAIILFPVLSDLFSVFASDLLPIFVIAGAGFALARWLKASAATLTHVVFYALLPCFAFRLLITTVATGRQFGLMVLLAVLVMLAMAVVGVLLSIGASPEPRRIERRCCSS